MVRIALLTVAVCLIARGQTMDFEIGSTEGWSKSGTVLMDDTIVHGGKWAARIERPAASGDDTSGFSKTVPVEFAGKTLTMRAFLRTEDVTGFAMLMLREDGPAGWLEFSNMRNQVKGTTDWKEYEISLPLNPDATSLFFAVLVSGSGKAWVDDIQVLVDGKPLAEVPKIERPKTQLETDHEFDGGSGIAVTELTEIQVANLSMLGKVWGFLKYHHPEVTGGRRHWDYDLFRIMPAVLAAKDRGTAQAAVSKWIAALGGPGACEKCATLDTADLHLRPALDWLGDEALLGADVSRKLRAIYALRPADGRQFYLLKARGAGNPIFPHELEYSAVKAGDSGYQILAALRYWNIIEYWFPYRDLLEGKWDAAMRDLLPKAATAQTRADYERAMIALIARVEDTHSNLWSSLAARPPVGGCQAPATVRFIEGQAVVTGAAGSLTVGDILTHLDGAPVAKLIREWRPYYAASNEPTRLREIARSMTRGACGTATFKVRRGMEEVEAKAERVPAPDMATVPRPTHDRPGDALQKLSPEIAYLKLSAVKAADAPSYIDRAAGTKGLVIDIRNYPSDFVVFALGQLLAEKITPFVRITRADPANPGAFRWDAMPTLLRPEKPHYGGKVVALVDEVSQSQSEYTAMAFRAAGAKVVGSTTAGADGNASTIPLPGGLMSRISGIGIFYPDKRPTQKVGIVPDIEVKPTIAGIRAGRDEVLEAAIRILEGK